jgi:serpin B
VAANVVYFKDQWGKHFSKSETRGATFYGTKEKTSTPTMYANEEYLYFKGAKIHFIEIPYRTKNLVMTILLPQKGHSLPELEKTLTVADLKQWSQKAEYQPLKLYVPRFKFGSDYHLEEILPGLGMKRAFKPEADFTGVLNQRPLYVNQALHKTRIEVDEEGTEAAAVSFNDLVLSGEVREPKVVRVDRPFLFMIRDTKSQLILFMGRVNQL